MDSPCALECLRALSTHLATTRITIYLVRGLPGTPPALQCARLSLPIRTCITAPIGRARRPAACARHCVREQRFACWPSSSLIERAPNTRRHRNRWRRQSRLPAQPSPMRLKSRDQAAPAQRFSGSEADSTHPDPRRRRSSSSGSQAVQLLNPPLAHSEDHVASCLACTGGTAASMSTFVKNGPSQPAAFAAASLDPGHSGANSPRNR